MEKVRLGNTSEKINKIGLGTMYFGSKVDKKTSFEILDFYLQKGGSFLDTANKYAGWVPGFVGGESENILGEWIKLRKNRSEIFLTSKVGFAYEDIPRTLKKDVIIAECERSLKRLGVETIDLYFAHAYDALTPIEDSMEAFHQLIEQGKVRYIGASNFPAWRLAQANSVARDNGWTEFVCLQQRHTYLEPGLRSGFGNQLLTTPEVEDFCQVCNITLIGYSPLLGGVYSNPELPVPDQYISPNTELRLKALDFVSAETGLSKNQLVLAWMLNSKPQILPLISGSTVAQIEENLKAESVMLSEEQLQKLNLAD